MIYDMKNTEKSSGWARALDWLLHPENLINSVLIVALILFTIFQLFSGTPQVWFFAALAAVVSAMTIGFWHYRSSVERAVSSVEGLRRELSDAVNFTTVREIPPALISEELSRLLSTADDWSFKGGSARWQRTTVLPSLAARTDAQIPYAAQIINPFDAELCKEYADYRRKQSTPKSIANGRSVTKERVQAELLSFVYAAAWYKNNSRIEPTISLLESYSPLRQDGSKTAMIMTVADLDQSGLMAEKGWYLTSLLDEFGIHASKPLVLPQVEVGDEGKSVVAVSTFFSELLSANQTGNLPPAVFDDYRDEDWEKILDFAFSIESS